MIGLMLDHIWQSTLFAAVAGLVAFLLRANSASVRYGIWLSASLKFLFPLALLTAGSTALSAFLPSKLPTTPVMAALDGAAPVITALDGVSQPFSVDTSRISAGRPLAPPQFPLGLEPRALALIWLGWVRLDRQSMAAPLVKSASYRSVRRSVCDKRTAPSEILVVPAGAGPGRHLSSCLASA